jgi:DNA-3-methyladenine glycosylase I
MTSTYVRRCAWASSSPLLHSYHDEEWGVPSHDDRHLFEMLILEGAQAGLGWITILKKREGYRKAYDNFDARKIARYSARKVASLVSDEGIVRNRLKVSASIDNARRFLEICNEFGSFDAYIWRFVGSRPLRNSWTSVEELPAITAESKAMSKDLVKRGFRFVGPTICYAYMQAVGMVNDHTTDCFRHRPVARLR